MKRYSFGTFLVDDSNREAYDVCNAVAALRPMPALPVVVIAPDQGGKTHLLYSIANRVKSTQPSTTLGFVRAGAFPEQVRELLRDPRPIERASNAVFLVDDIDEFSTHGEALEGVVRLFLEHGHTVVMASSQAPESLVNLTPGLRELIAGGLHVRIGAHHPSAAAMPAQSQTGWEEGPFAAELAASRGREDEECESEAAQAEIAQWQHRVLELEAELEHVRADLALKTATEQDVERLRAVVEGLKEREQRDASAMAAAKAGSGGGEEVEKLEAELASARVSQTGNQERMKALQREVRSLQEELKGQAALRTEIEYLQRELAVLRQSQHEQAAADQEAETLRAEHQHLIMQRDAVLEELRASRESLVAAQADAQAQRQQNAEFSNRIRGLVASLEARRQRAREDEEGQTHLLNEVESLVAQRLPLLAAGYGGEAGAGLAQLHELLETERAAILGEWEEKTSLLEQAVSAAQERTEQVAAECARLQVEAEQREAENRDLQQMVNALTGDKNELTARLEALRAERDDLIAARARWEEERGLFQEEIAHVEHDHRELVNTLEEQRIELEMARIALEARKHESDSKENSAAQLRAERDCARAALESTRTEHERIRSQHKAVQRRLETALAELDALRHEAATQVAAAHAQAGELEKRLSATQEQYYHARHAGQHVARELRELEQRFMETSEFVAKMSTRLTTASDRDSAAAEAAYLHALTRREPGSEASQLPLEINGHDKGEETAAPGESDAPPANPYDDGKFIPFKPADHKINRII